MAVTYTTATGTSVQTAATFATPEIKEYYEMELLARAFPELYHSSFTKIGKIPERAGGLIEWRKVKSLNVATTPLVEGVTPASVGPDIGYVRTEPLWYGSFIRASDVFLMTAIDDVWDEYSTVLGEQAGETADVLCRDLMVASGTAQIVGQTARGSITAADTLTADELLKAWATLKAQNARGFDFIDGRFAVIIHSYAWKDLLRDAEFKNAIQQAAPRSDEHPLFTGEVFDFMGLRFFISSNAKLFADAAGTVDVYITLVIGRDSIGLAGIGNAFFNMELGMGGTGERVMPVQLIVKPVGSGGPVDDPLDQVGSIGWKASQQEVELDANWMVRIEHACSMGTNV